MRTYIKVCIKHGRSLSREDIKDYVEDAVKAWRGCYNPEEDGGIFDLNSNDMTVGFLSERISNVEKT